MNIQLISEQTATEAALLGLALLLSSLIGLERHRKLKSAGMRTHALVGLGSAVFTLIGAYGFLGSDGPSAGVDASRIAAQIVSGIGFLGAGVIFVRRGSISGLTTAASIWATAAVGMACGAGQPVLALMATTLHLAAVTTLGWLGKVVKSDPPSTEVRLKYRPGEGALGNALALAAEHDVPVVVRASRTIHRGAKRDIFGTDIRLERSEKELADLLDQIASLPGVQKLKVRRDDE